MTYPPRPNQNKTSYKPPPVPVDPWAETQVSYVPTAPPITRRTPSRRQRRRTHLPCALLACLPLLVIACLVGVVVIGYSLMPGRSNILVLGLDYTDPYSTLARSDTIILTTFIPNKPYVGMLSIPRDLWVKIPGVGENRINTAHFFAEAQQKGAGPAAAMQTIRQNFGVDVNYYARIRFDGFREVIDALGGVDVYLDKPAAGYEAGWHHFTGNKALAFVRERYGSDDFFRMEHGQLLIKAVFKELLNPLKWVRLPAVVNAILKSVDTNIPTWMWPRLIIALLRVGPGGVDNRTIQREMVKPFTTDQGAQVLLPDWSKINPLLMQMFGQ
jgi:polyisoprenyl-teichoic acid--peptidoglycan teichoic acid transferase